MRLLPRNRELGWTPYAWLIYLGFFVMEPVLGRGSAGEWSATGLALAVFLPLYFWGYWQDGKPRLYWAIVGIAALGALCAPWNPGASVFFIYAASFCGMLAPPGRAIRSIAAVLLLVAVESWLFGLPFQSWLPAAVFVPLIGGINLHFSEFARERARLRETQDRLAQIAERERIARDLHDLLGHSLSLITLKAELAGKLFQREPERAAAEVREVERISRQALREVRSAVAGYRSTGIEGELARARLALESADIACELLVAPVELERTQETVLALALREAITNVVRHAGATSCRLRLEPVGAGVRLEVEDNGRGGLAAEGIGLSAMRERVEGLGGRVERHGEGGTRLLVTLPRRLPPDGEGAGALAGTAPAPAAGR